MIPAAEKPNETATAIHNNTTDSVVGVTATTAEHVAVTDPAWFTAHTYDAKQSK